mmetsp:Transcript_25165/g.81181  ORF Transcript_25165/g.81181 Transcript_25165/m.81181 type:complete len:253 (-) Transcript_25165:699-1457(-)
MVEPATAAKEGIGFTRSGSALRELTVTRTLYCGPLASDTRTLPCASACRTPSPVSAPPSSSVELNTAVWRPSVTAHALCVAIEAVPTPTPAAAPSTSSASTAAAPARTAEPRCCSQSTSQSPARFGSLNSRGVTPTGMNTTVPSPRSSVPYVIPGVTPRLPRGLLRLLLRLLSARLPRPLVPPPREVEVMDGVRGGMEVSSGEPLKAGARAMPPPRPLPPPPPLSDPTPARCASTRRLNRSSRRAAPARAHT